MAGNFLLTQMQYIPASPDYHYSPTAVGLKDYLASLQRISRSLSQMTATKLRVNQEAINGVSDLISQGNMQLQALFGSILEEDAQKIEPLHYITKRNVPLDYHRFQAYFCRTSFSYYTAA